MNEAEWTDRVIEAAQWRGWLVAHFRPARTSSGGWSTAMKGNIGYPDLTLARAGVVMFRELKTDKGRLTVEQQAWLDALGPLGGVWRPRDWNQVLAELGPAPSQPRRTTARPRPRGSWPTARRRPGPSAVADLSILRDEQPDGMDQAEGAVWRAQVTDTMRRRHGVP